MYITTVKESNSMFGSSWMGNSTALLSNVIESLGCVNLCYFPYKTITKINKLHKSPCNHFYFNKTFIKKLYESWKPQFWYLIFKQIIKAFYASPYITYRSVRGYLFSKYYIDRFGGPLLLFSAEWRGRPEKKHTWRNTDKRQWNTKTLSLHIPFYNSPLEKNPTGESRDEHGTFFQYQTTLKMKQLAGICLYFLTVNNLKKKNCTSLHFKIILWIQYNHLLRCCPRGNIY